MSKPAEKPDAEVVDIAKKGSRLWTPEQAREMARRSSEVRKARTPLATIDRLRKLVAEEKALLPKRGEFKGLAEQALAKILLQLAAGELKPKTMAEALSMGKALLEIIRIESNEPTSITSTFVDRSAIEAQVRELQARAEEQRTQRIAGVVPDVPEQ